MVLDRIKSTVGRINPLQRYADTEQSETPDQQLDPQEWHHSAKPGLGKRLQRSKRTLVTYGAFIAVAIGLAYFYSQEFVIGLVSNPLVQSFVTHGGLFAIGLVLGIRSFRARLIDWDWLVLQVPEGIVPMVGEYETADDGTNIFVPYAGIDWLGFRSRQLTLGELGQSVARTFAKRGRSMDSGARVRVNDAIAARRQTAFGTIVGVMTDGLAVDEFGQHSDVYTQPPETVDQEQYQRLRSQLEQFAEQTVPKLRTDKQMLQQQVDDLRARLQQSDDEAIDLFINRYSRVEQAREPEPEEPLPAENDGAVLAGITDGESGSPGYNGGGPS